MPKSPPAFAEDKEAWDYTLARLALRGKLTDNGDPRNYAAAAAIYKNVKKKYPNGVDYLALLYAEANQ
jgi:hypothetical protein